MRRLESVRIAGSVVERQVETADANKAGAQKYDRNDHGYGPDRAREDVHEEKYDKDRAHHEADSAVHSTHVFLDFHGFGSEMSQ